MSRRSDRKSDGNSEQSLERVSKKKNPSMTDNIGALLRRTRKVLCRVQKVDLEFQAFIRDSERLSEALGQECKAVSGNGNEINCARKTKSIINVLLRRITEVLSGVEKINVEFETFVHESERLPEGLVIEYRDMAIRITNSNDIDSVRKALILYTQSMKQFQVVICKHKNLLEGAIATYNKADNDSVSPTVIENDFIYLSKVERLEIKEFLQKGKAVLASIRMLRELMAEKKQYRDSIEGSMIKPFGSENGKNNANALVKDNKQTPASMNLNQVTFFRLSRRQTSSRRLPTIPENKEVFFFSPKRK